LGIGLPVKLAVDLILRIGLRRLFELRFRLFLGSLSFKGLRTRFSLFCALLRELALVELLLGEALVFLRQLLRFLHGAVFLVEFLFRLAPEDSAFLIGEVFPTLI